MFPPRVSTKRTVVFSSGGSQQCKHKRHTLSEENTPQQPQATTHPLLARFWREVTSIWRRQANAYTQRSHDFAQLRRGFFLLPRVGRARTVSAYWRVWAAGHSFDNADVQSRTSKSTYTHTRRLARRPCIAGEETIPRKISGQCRRTSAFAWCSVSADSRYGQQAVRHPAAMTVVTVVVSKAAHNTGMSYGRPALSHTEDERATTTPAKVQRLINTEL